MDIFNNKASHKLDGREGDTDDEKHGHSKRLSHTGPGIPVP